MQILPFVCTQTFKINPTIFMHEAPGHFHILRTNLTKKIIMNSHYNTLGD